MPPPFLQKNIEYMFLALLVDDMYIALRVLLESVNTVNRLNEVVELIVYPSINSRMTMLLEVASLPCDFRFSR